MYKRLIAILLAALLMSGALGAWAEPEDIEVDGGIVAETGQQCREAGADYLVSGSYLFHAADPRAAVQSLR